MSISTPKTTKTTTKPHRSLRRLSLVAVIVLAGLLIVLSLLLLRRLGPQSEVWLRITPAAATVDQSTAIGLSSGGWQRNEQVAVCLNRPEDAVCTAEAALLVERADTGGNLNTSVLAGAQLAAGRTIFLVQGLESGRQASRSFRVLRAPDSPLLAGRTEQPSTVAGQNDLTPIAGVQIPDSLEPVAGGWAAEYFANPDLLGPPAVVREDMELAFDWGAAAPDPALPTDGFSARWLRGIVFAGMTHRFLVQADGGVRLYVDDALVIDQWQDDGLLATSSATIDLTAGEHVVRVEYFDQRGNAAIVLRWEAIDLYPDWRGEYFTNPDLAGQAALVRNDPDPNFDWGEGGPAPGVIPSDGFSARWTRSLEFAPGLYRFVLTAEDGGRLLVEGQTVIDAWQGRAGETIIADRTLSGGQYQVVIHFRNLSGPARVAVGWSPLATPMPVQVAGVDPLPTPTPDVLSSPPPALPGDTPTATPTVDPGNPPTFTPTPTPTAPVAGATETASPTSSVTASPTETSATPNGATSTPTPTATPDAGGAPLLPPGSVERLIEINPSVGAPGQVINITSGNWSPGTVVRVALGEFGASYTQAVALPGVSFTTPSDSSQSFTFTFAFPTQPPWSTQTRPVQVWVYNAGWTEWGRDYYDVDQP